MAPELVGSPLLDTFLTLGLAALLGGVIGLDREASGKPAGFRTNILICVGAALLTALSIDVAERWVRLYGTVADPGRIAAQIVSGIGFLGAGTIIQSRRGVRGLTTAATIWVVAASGMAVGAGAWRLARVSRVGVVLTLGGFTRIEGWIEPRARDDRWVRVWLGRAEPGAHRSILAMLRERGVRIRSVDVDARDEVVQVVLRAEARNREWDGVLDALLAFPNVVRASLE
jgi:putative Mg2+ transporter-C (MgtC) family protein